MSVSDLTGEPLYLEASNLLTSEKGNIRGYDYFSNERSLIHSEGFHAVWPFQPPEGNEVAMDVLMPAGEELRIFSVDAPANRAVRGKGWPASFWNQPMPTLIVRRQGEAWTRPFVTVYAPRHGNQPVAAREVEALGENSWRVSGDGWKVDFELDGRELSYELIRQ